MEMITNISCKYVLLRAKSKREVFVTGKEQHLYIGGYWLPNDPHL